MDELCIEVSKFELLNRLKKYKERYEKSLAALMKEFERKTAAYQVKYEKWRAAVIAKKSMKQPHSPMKPEDRTKEYKFFIRAIQEHRRAYVTLPLRFYKMLYLDKWEWMPRHIFALNAWAADSEEIATASAAYGGES